MNWYGLFPIIIGLILAIKPDIKFLPILHKGGGGIKYRWGIRYPIIYRIGGIICLVLGILVLFEVIHVSGL
jgi:hypothetical protein